MKFIFESESTINGYAPDYTIDYTIDYERDVEDAEIDFEPKAIALDLLTIKGVEKLPESVRNYSDNYWLRSPGGGWNHIAIVTHDGEVNLYGNVNYSIYNCVRPALTLFNLDSSNLELYKEYTIFDKKWIYIGDNRFLYNDKMIKRCFDEESNKYEFSEIKRFLNDWLRKLQNKDLTVEEA